MENRIEVPQKTKIELPYDPPILLLNCKDTMHPTVYCSTIYNSQDLGGSDSKESACNEGGLSSIPGSEDPLEKGIATYSSILAWRIAKESGSL